MRFSFLFLALCGLLLASLRDQPAVAREKVAPVKNRADRVNVEAVPGKVREDGSQIVTITVRIDEGWYVYAPGGCEEFEGIKLKITAHGKMKPEKVLVDYPPGKEVKSKVLDLGWNIYTGKVEIPVAIWRAKGDTEPLEIKVRYYPMPMA